MGSSRLPGKVLTKLANKPSLWHIVDRLRHSNKLSKVIIATSVREIDDPIEKFCIENKVECERGSEEDVLDRYFQIAEKYKPDVIVRVTGDCPLVDPSLLDHMITDFLTADYDYYSNAQPVRSFPKGMDLEIFSLSALKKAYQEAKESYDREHVTSYIYNNPEAFKIGILELATDVSKVRLTLDTKEDLETLEAIFNALYKPGEIFSLQEAMNYLELPIDLYNYRSFSREQYTKK